MNVVSQLLYLGWWFFRTRFLGRRKPLQSVVFVTNGCNSTCRHCTNCTKSGGSYYKTFDEIAKDLEYCYAEGARILDIEGVNLLHWQDGGHQVNEIFQLAKDKNFYSTSTMIPASNYAAWKAMGIDVDVLWVSIMGINDCNSLKTLNDASLFMVLNTHPSDKLHLISTLLSQGLSIWH